MSQNIKNNYVKFINSKLYNKHYYDYMLFRGEVNGECGNDVDSKLIADFSKLNIVSGVLYSTVTWSGATSDDIELKDIGLTGVDNGFITYDKDRITNEEFLKLYLNSTYTIQSGDTRLFLSPVTGNTKLYEYPMFLYESGDTKYIAFKGGFYQGFFKLYGFDYEVLPTTFTDDIVLHFEIRPRSDYETSDKTVNNIHKENEGIFFFLGTRAENKFWPFYNISSATTRDKRPSEEIPYDADELCLFVENEWLKLEPTSYIIKEHLDSLSNSTNEPIILENKDSIKATFLNTYNFNPYNYCGCDKKDDGGDDSGDDQEECTCDNYFADDYLKTDECVLPNGKSIDEEYIKDDIDIKNVDIEDSEGHELKKHGYYEIKDSDNKFLMFDRTEDGFTTDNWIEGTTVTLTGRTDWPDTNYFLLFNRTETGYTTHTIDSYNETHGKEYNIYKDIRNNVFALRINENGGIGYRYGILNCDEGIDNHYEVVEEYSKDGMVKMDEWNSINVRFAIIHPPKDKCDTRSRKMRIMIYVNGFLKFISKELDTLNFKALDEVVEKQEGVPYNISLGGGSIGLLETILPNYYKIPEYILPIEKDFCGTFIGDIRSFQIYQGFICYSGILNYLSNNNN